MEKILVVTHAKAIVCCDQADTVLYDVDMLCRNGVISAIGKHAKDSVQDHETAEYIDGRNLFFYPGLINTHHHFFQAFVRNQAELDWTKLSLVQWLDRIYRIFTLINEDCIYHSSVVCMSELLKHGCTTAFDHQYCFNKHAGSYLIDRQFEAAEKLGMRFVAGRGTNTLSRDLGSTIPDEMCETTDRYLADCQRIIASYHDPKPMAMRSLVLAPCQPVNCHPETFTESVSLAKEHGLSLHTHLSEGENALMLERTGMRSLDWCIDKGFVGDKVWIAHGWEMTRDEMFKMAELDIGLSHCAPAMCLVGDGTTNLNAAYAAGVRIGLGVDGCASNDNSNLLECIRLAYLLQVLVARDRIDPVPAPRDFLKFATKGGADLLNRPELGQLKVGMAADFFAVDTEQIDYVGAEHDPRLLLVKMGLGKEVSLTAVNGEIVWRDGAFTRFEEAEAATDARMTFNKVIYESEIMKKLHLGQI